MTILRASDRPVPGVCGAKAAALGIASQAGLPVPDWFVITSEGDTAEAIAGALRALCPNGEPVAVRSSAIDEDGRDHSFAGQLESFLNVSPADVVGRARMVRQSALDQRALAYRRHHQLGTPPSHPAVIVQRMVTADCAGVAFSADPVTGRRGIAVISAVRGLGESLVSGASQGDTYHVDRSGAIVSRSTTASQPVLTDVEILAVAALARQAARLFGRPQDIEWAFASGRLHLLQARPITSLRETPDRDGVLRLWDNSNIVESYAGVTAPLTFSFAREAYENVYRQFCRIMRVPSAVIADHDHLFRNMIGLIHGRVYYNLLSWYRLIALLPGFTLNRRFMEQMMGVRDRLPASMLPAAAPPTLRQRIRDACRLAGVLAGLIGAHLGLGRRTREFYGRVDAALAAPDPPLGERRTDELCAYYDDLRRQLLTRWDAPILNDFFTMIFYGALRDLASRWCGDADGSLQNDLIAGEDGMVSTQPARRVRQLADLAGPFPGFARLLLTGTMTEILEAAREVPAFLRQYDAYLRVFGERCADELKLESTTLNDDPLPLLRAIGRLANREADAEQDANDRRRTRKRGAAEARVARALASHPLRRAAFGWILRNARARVRDRENMRFVRTRLFGRVRRVFVEIGLRLHEQGHIDDPRDVFWLQVEEILGFVDGRAVTTELRPLVAARRAEFGRHTERTAPDSRFETRGPVYDGNTFRAQPPIEDPRDPHADSEAARRGVGCCPGIRRGKVQVVRDPATAVLAAGSILVAERTDPGWIMIFPAASGLIVERGSLLSHSAIVARELGLPAIVSVDGVTSWLRDGDWVEMDGSTGIVRKLAA